MRRRNALLPVEHNRAAEQLSSLRNTAVSLLNHLDGKVSPQDLGQVKILLNIISQIQLQLDADYERSYQPADNPYAEEVVWFAD